MWKTSQFGEYLVANMKWIWIIFVLKNFISSISFETFLTLSLNYVKFCTKYHCFIWFFSWTFNFNLILVEWEPSVFTFRYLTRLSPIFFRSKATFFMERCKIDFKDVKIWLVLIGIMNYFSEEETRKNLLVTIWINSQNNQCVFYSLCLMIGVSHCFIFWKK